MGKNNYSQVWIDGSFILTRALFALLRNNNPSEITPGDIIRVNIQTISKLSRDWGISGRKIIIIWDKWGQAYNGYIRSWLLRDHLKYKGSRKIITEETFREIERTGTEKEIARAKKELETNLLKQKTKAAMIEELPKLGICSYFYPGYEFDDIVTLASFYYYGKTDLPNIIVTKDTDLRYSLCPGACDFFSLPTYGSKPEIITYDSMYKTIPEPLRNRGIGLYQYNAMMNAAGFFGHNDMIVTKKKGSNPVTTLLNILDDNYSEISDPELYKLQYQTYNLSNFPDIDKVREDISKFELLGTFGSLVNFREFCNKFGVTDITENYYLRFLGHLDEKYYSQ